MVSPLSRLFPICSWATKLVKILFIFQIYHKNKINHILKLTENIYLVQIRLNGSLVSRLITTICYYLGWFQLIKTIEFHKLLFFQKYFCATHKHGCFNPKKTSFSYHAKNIQWKHWSRSKFQILLPFSFIE